MGENTLRNLITLAIVFVLGVLATNVYAQVAAAQNNFEITTDPNGGYEYPSENIIERAVAMFEKPSEEQPSPKDRISEDQIRVTRDKIEINLKGADWAEFTDTNSMDPVIDAEAHAIEVKPKNEEDIQAGDIVAYESEYAEGTIIHRVVYKGQDEKGTYFLIKGDNNPTTDPGRIRFNQIKRVVVAIIY